MKYVQMFYKTAILSIIIKHIQVTLPKPTLV